MNKILISIPIFVVIIISIFLLIFLIQDKDPNKPPSSMINEKTPNFKMVSLFNKDEYIINDDLDNQITIINFFASWCIPCKAEHPLFFKIKKKFPNLFILGINMRDKKEEAVNFLDQDGNPYDYIGVDKNGLVAIEFGVVGIPETFLVNKSGKIIYKYLGPLTEEIIENEIYPHL